VEGSAYIGGVIVCLGYLIAAARLGRLSLKTGEKPERLLAITFLFWGVAYVGWQLPIVLSDDALVLPLYFSARILTDIGTVLSVFFLRLVFRPGSALATAMVIGITVSVVVGVAGSAWVGDWEALYPLKNLWWWLEWGAVILSMGWMALEGFHHYGMAKMRQRLGLCDALTCNRYLLWGFIGLIWSFYELSYAIQQIEFEVTGLYSTQLDAFASSLEMIPIVLVWFVFFPPAIYQRWIARSDPQPIVAEA